MMHSKHDQADSIESTHLFVLHKHEKTFGNKLMSDYLADNNVMEQILAMEY